MLFVSILRVCPTSFLVKRRWLFGLCRKFFIPSSTLPSFVYPLIYHNYKCDVFSFLPSLVSQVHDLVCTQFPRRFSIGKLNILCFPFTFNPLPAIIEISVFVINHNLIKNFCVGGALNIYITFQHYNSHIL